MFSLNLLIYNRLVTLGYYRMIFFTLNLGFLLISNLLKSGAQELAADQKSIDSCSPETRGQALTWFTPNQQHRNIYINFFQDFYAQEVKFCTCSKFHVLMTTFSRGWSFRLGPYLYLNMNDVTWVFQKNYSRGHLRSLKVTIPKKVKYGQYAF